MESVATNGVKGEVIRARLDEDLKIRLKKMCKDKKIIDSRAEGTEKKLQKLREKLKVPK